MWFWRTSIWTKICKNSVFWTKLCFKKYETLLLDESYENNSDTFYYLTKNRDVNIFSDNDKYFIDALKYKNLKSIKNFYLNNNIDKSNVAKNNALTLFIDKSNTNIDIIKFILKQEVTSSKDKEKAFSLLSLTNTHCINHRYEEVFNLFLKQKNIDFYANNNEALSNFVDNGNELFVNKILEKQSDFLFDSENDSLIKAYMWGAFSTYPNVFNAVLNDNRTNIHYDRDKLLKMVLKREDFSLFKKLIENKKFGNYVSLNLMETAYLNKNFNFLIEILKVQNVKEYFLEKYNLAEKEVYDKAISGYKIQNNLVAF